MAEEATQRQSPTPNKPLADNSQEFEEGWRSLTMEDDVDLVVSITEPNVEEKMNKELENDTAVENRPLSTSEPHLKNPEESSGPVPKKLITRPSSLHDEFVSGFSFGKAKPAPKFGFSRTPKEATFAPSKRDATPPSAQAQRPDQSPRLGGTKSPGSSQQTPLTVPFPSPLVVPTTSMESRANSLVAHAASRNETSNTEKTNDISLSAYGTLIGGDPRIETRQQQRPSSRAPGNAAIVSHPPAPVEAGNSKNRRKKRRATASTQQREGLKSLLIQASPDDLFEMQRYREQKMEQQLLETLHLAEYKSREVEELDQKLREFAIEYQRLQEELEGKQAAIAKFEAIKSTWDSKVKKLSDSVKGLCNDHNRLRDSARDNQDQRDHVHSEEASIQSSLTTLKQSHDISSVKSQQLVAKYQLSCETLKQTVKTLQHDIEASQGNLGLERERNERLERELTRITSGDEQLKKEFANNCGELNSKLNILIDKAQQAAVLTEAHAEQASTPMLEECLALIQDIAGRRNVQPEDLHKLDISLKGYTDSVQQSMQAHEELSAKTLITQERLTALVQGELQTLCGHATTGKLLQEQVAEHREEKAAVRDQLENARLELTKAKCEISSFGAKDEEQRRKIIELEAEITNARQNPADAAATMLRLHDLEVSNKSLEGQKLAVQKELEGVTHQIQLKSDEVANLNTRLNGLQLQLEDAQAAQETLRNERADYEKEVETQRAHDKRALSEAAENAMSRLQGEFENEKQQLLHKLEGAEKEIKKLMARQEYTLTDKDNSKEEAANARKALDKMAIEKQIENEIAQTLKGTVKELEAKLKNSNQQQEDLQSQISRLQEDMESSRIQRNELQAKLNRAQQENETRKIRQVTRFVDSSRAPISQVEPHAHLTRSKHFSALPAEVKDSQSRDDQACTAIEDIMNDPFCSAAQEESQLDTGDFASLFPSTPDTQDVQEERSHTFTSQTETKVVSRRSHTVKPGSNHHQEHDVGLSRKNSQTRKNFSTSQRKAPEMMVGRDLSYRHSADAGPDLKEEKENPVAIPNSLAPLSNAHALLKRDSVTAGFTKPNTAAKKSCRQNTQLQQLGPVIGDSQSPNHSRLLGGRGRKLSSKSGKKTWHDNKMDARFRQELGRT